MTKPTGRPRGRPRKTPPPPAPEVDIDDLIGAPDEDEAEEDITFDIAETYGGVSAHWLGQMFGMDKATVKKKLAKAGVPIVGRRGRGPLFRLVDAAPYMVKPKIDVEEFIRNMRPNDLPPMLSDMFWAAMLKKQKWELNAADLWRTEDVLSTLGDLWQTIRSRVTLWAEDVDRAHGLTEAQRQEINKLADGLLHSIYQHLVELPNSRKQTRSTLAEQEDLPNNVPEGHDE